MSETINLTAYEKKCASKLARAFYDYDSEWQKDLPPFNEVFSVAKELIHHEKTSEWRERLRWEEGTPLMPGDGFDYVGVEYYFEKGTEYYGNLRESLKACMRSTYEALEGNMTNHEKSVLALTEGFREGVISAFEEFGDTRLVPYPEEIQKAADMVLKEEKTSLVLRDAARLRFTYKKENEPPYPKQCPIYMKRYSKVGGELYLENPMVSLEDALKVSAKASYLEWFQKYFPKQEN